MKKALLLFLVLAVLFSVTACVPSSDPPKKETDATNGENTSAEETTVPDLAFALNETAVFSDLKITATEIKKSGGGDFNKPEDGKIFIGVKFTIENTSDEALAMSSLLQFEAYADDIKCSYSINASISFNEGTLDGELAVGKKMVGYYAIEVPADTEIIEINFSPSVFSSDKAVFVLNVPEA